MTDTDLDRWRGRVESQFLRLEAAVEELQAVGSPFGGPHKPKVKDEEVEKYPDLDAWVEGYFRAVFVRPLGGEFRWCTQWRQHREAEVRLDALWSSWKARRRDDELGMATWLQANLDSQLPILLGSRGPFGLCTSARHDVSFESRN